MNCLANVESIATMNILASSAYTYNGAIIHAEVWVMLYRYTRLSLFRYQWSCIAIFLGIYTSNESVFINSLSCCLMKLILQDCQKQFPHSHTSRSHWAAALVVSLSAIGKGCEAQTALEVHTNHLVSLFILHNECHPPPVILPDDAVEHMGKVDLRWQQLEVVGKPNTIIQLIWWWSTWDLHVNNIIGTQFKENNVPGWYCSSVISQQ